MNDQEMTCLQSTLCECLRMLSVCLVVLIVENSKGVCCHSVVLLDHVCLTEHDTKCSGMMYDYNGGKQLKFV